MNLRMDSDYITVKLFSDGKLSSPKEVKIRNFIVKEVLSLSETINSGSVIDFTKSYLSILKNMTKSEAPFSIYELTENEIMELLLNIYGTFWSDSIMVPIITENNETKVTRVKVNEIVSTNFNEDFKEPIILEIDDLRIMFRLPRVKDAIQTKKSTDGAELSNYQLGLNIIESCILEVQKDGSIYKDSIQSLPPFFIFPLIKTINEFESNFGPVTVKKEDGTVEKIRRNQFRVSTIFHQFDQSSKHSQFNIRFGDAPKTE